MPVPKKLHNEMSKWLEGLMPMALARRKHFREKMAEHNEAVMRTKIERVTGTDTSSNVNVPYIRAQRKAERTRLYQVLFGQKPAVRIRNIKGSDENDSNDPHDVAREATDYFEYTYKRKDELNARNTMRMCIMQFVDHGLCVWKIAPIKTARYTGPRWAFISVGDLLWPSGMGTEIAELPWVGNVYSLSEPLIRAQQWDKADVEAILAEDDKGEIAAHVNDVLTHIDDPLQIVSFDELKVPRGDFAEIWFMWSDGKRYKADIHLRSLRTMNIDLAEGDTLQESPPYFVARRDEIAPEVFEGVGIPEELSAVQEIMNVIYNGALDSIKVSTQHARLIRYGSMLASMVGTGDEMIPISNDFQCVTESPSQDLAVVPLGDARGAAAAIGVVGDLKNMIAELTGMSPAMLSGNIGMTRRSPAFGIDAVMRQGSFPIRDIASRLAEAFQDAVLYTFELFAEWVPSGRAYQILGDDGKALENALFDLSGARASEMFAVEVDVADPSRAGEQEEQQSALLRAQFVVSWMTQVATLVTQAIASPELPAGFRSFLVHLAARSEEAIRRVLELANEIQDPDALLLQINESLGPAVEEYNRQIEQAMALAQQQGNVGAGPPQGPPAQRNATLPEGTGE